jgi:hypothetical protein
MRHRGFHVNWLASNRGNGETATDIGKQNHRHVSFEPGTGPPHPIYTKLSFAPTVRYVRKPITVAPVFLCAEDFKERKELILLLLLFSRLLRLLQGRSVL